MTSPAELQAITRYDFATDGSWSESDSGTFVGYFEVEMLQKRLDAQSDEVRRLREALVTSRKVLVVACGDKAPFVRVALDVIDAALGSQP